MPDDLRERIADLRRLKQETGGRQIGLDGRERLLEYTDAEGVRLPRGQQSTGSMYPTIANVFDADAGRYVAAAANLAPALADEVERLRGENRRLRRMLNPCPCSFQHQPHDSCDGSPAVTTICPTCNGDGGWRDTDGEPSTCDECGGSGTVPADALKGATRDE